MVKTTDSKKSEVFKVKTHNLAPIDLEAEIAAMASTIGEAETVGGRPQTKASVKRKSSKPVQKVPESTRVALKPEIVNHPASSMVSSGEEVIVNPEASEKPNMIPSRQNADDEPAAEPIAVMTHPKPVVAKVKMTSVIKGKTIGDVIARPIHPATAKKPTQNAIPVITRPPIISQSHPEDSKQNNDEFIAPETEVEVVNEIELPAPVVEARVVAPAEEPEDDIDFVDTEQAEPDKVSDEQLILQAVAEKAQTTKPQKRVRHVARIFDTTTYHMPISVDHHSRKAALPRWARIVVLLVAIAGMIVYGFATNLY